MLDYHVCVVSLASLYKGTLSAHQVAALSGDARRALDICRRATELAEVNTGLVLMTHVNAAIQEMYSSPKIVAMRCVQVVYNSLFVIGC